MTIRYPGGGGGGACIEVGAHFFFFEIQSSFFFQHFGAHFLFFEIQSSFFLTFRGTFSFTDFEGSIFSSLQGSKKKDKKRTRLESFIEDSLYISWK